MSASSSDVTRSAALTSDDKWRFAGVDDAEGANLVEAGLRIGFIVRGRLVETGVVAREMCEETGGGEEKEGAEEEGKEEEEEEEKEEAGAGASECDGGIVAPLLVIVALGVEGEPASYTRGGLGGGG